MITIDLAMPADLEELTSEARMDNHPVCLPSYVIRKDNRISGYISFVTAMHGWLHTKRIRPIETFRTVFPAIDNMARSNGISTYSTSLAVSLISHPLQSALALSTLAIQYFSANNFNTI